MAPPDRILGVYRLQSGGGGRIVPTDKRAKAEWSVPAGADGGARPGEIVLATALPSTGYGLQRARVVERLGSLEATNTYIYEVGVRRAHLHEATSGRRAGRSVLRGFPVTRRPTVTETE